MFLVVIAILSIVLAFDRPVYRLLSDVEAVLAVVTAATLVPPIVAALVSRRVLSLLERDPEEPSHGQAALGRGSFIVQTLLTLGHGFALLCTMWLPLPAAWLGVQNWLVLPSLLAITPFLLSVVLVWIALYPADRAVRQIALEVYLFRQRPIRPVWSLGRYLVYNLRHQLLFVLIPMLLIVAARDLIFAYEPELQRLTGHPYVSDLLLGCSAVLVAIIAPEILRHVWSTQRLPEGPLRDRLQALCRTLGVRYREILVWRAGGMVVNAAVMGVLAPVRYLLITDGMLEQLEDRKIEAVIGHEAGHVKEHHIFYFLMFALISGCAVTIFSIRAHPLGSDTMLFQMLAALLAALLVVKWGIVFGWISRRFERQADMFGARSLALNGLPCELPCPWHGNTEGVEAPLIYPPRDGDALASIGLTAVSGPPQTATSRSGQRMRRAEKTSQKHAVCTSAALVFSQTLNDVAVLNGIAPEGRSWRHGSISLRSRTLQRLARDPRAAARVERRISAIKIAILATAIGSAAWAASELELWRLIGIGAGN